MTLWTRMTLWMLGGVLTIALVAAVVFFHTGNGWSFAVSILCVMVSFPLIIDVYQKWGKPWHP